MAGTHVGVIGLADMGGPTTRRTAGAGIPAHSMPPGSVISPRRALLRKHVDLLAAPARLSRADPGALVEQAVRFLERSTE